MGLTCSQNKSVGGKRRSQNSIPSPSLRIVNLRNLSFKLKLTASVRRTMNAISKIKDGVGQWLVEAEDIQRQIEKHTLETFFDLGILQMTSYNKGQRRSQLRLIIDNVLLAFEVYHYLKTKKWGKEGHMALKLDISKAYDKKEERSGRLQGVAICRQAPQVSLLLFAEDTLIFCQATVDATLGILEGFLQMRVDGSHDLYLGLPSMVGSYDGEWQKSILHLAEYSCSPTDGSGGVFAGELVQVVQFMFGMILGFPGPSPLESYCRAIPINMIDGDDFVVWHHTASGKFFVRSAYHVAVSLANQSQSSTSQPHSPLWKALWQANVPRKIRVFTWKLGQNALPLGVNLQQRIQDLECLSHLCWALVSDFSFDSCGWLEKLAKNFPKLEFESVITICWAIWWNRNRSLMERTFMLAGELLSFSLNYLFTFRQVTATPTKLAPPTSPVSWSLPGDGATKLNYDGAMFSSSLEIGIGVIARDSTGVCVWWKSIRKRWIIEPEMVEALAAREAVLLARRFSWRRVVLEGDCANIHSKLISHQPDSSTTGAVIRDIKCLVFEFDLCSFLLVRRAANKVANCLVRKITGSGIGVLEWVTKNQLDWLFSIRQSLSNNIRLMNKVNRGVELRIGLVVMKSRTSRLGIEDPMETCTKYCSLSS
ncbi:hypothetical protein Sango_1177200 [Sesamum angolense]|uniref:RNase H type-1 domain-containing protein n=1 Tax=Sesamum angolense TaxID=2727404 RepID=A0AAE1WWI0_9LAMI|nr:hypothetical protein Sango_1177200 [Sesamum angolense]